MPALSVIIPTYNRAERLRACLESLAQQKHPASDFEVLVVADGSTDNTRAMLAELDLPYSLRVVWQQNSGPAVARNRGVETARGRFCLFVDDDMLAGPELVGSHLRRQRQCGGVVAVGRIGLSETAHNDWFGRSYARSWRRHYIRLDQGRRAPLWTDCYAGNLSVPRAAFLEAGGFVDDLATEDIELGFRLQQQGLSVAYVSEAYTEQSDYKDFGQLIAEAETRGRRCVELWRRHPAMLSELLGDFNGPKLREVLLRRLLLAFSITPFVLVWFGSLLAKQSQQDSWFRFIYQYSYWRGVRRAVADRETWRRLTHSTTILMYHAFGEADEPPHRFVVPAHRLSRQMFWLRLMRYRVISLEEYVAYRRSYRLPPARAVVITMDDGYRDNRTVAYPILRRYGFPATIFLVSGAVGGCNEWDEKGKLTGRALLSWADIEEMKSGGISFGAHTQMHPRLTDIAPEQMRREIRGSCDDLAEVLSPKFPLFAYPYGSYDDTVSAEVEEAGFAASCSVDSGINVPATPLYTLRRMEVWGTDSILHFALSLWLGDARAWLRR